MAFESEYAYWPYVISMVVLLGLCGALLIGGVVVGLHAYFTQRLGICHLRMFGGVLICFLCLCTLALAVAQGMDQLHLAASVVIASLMWLLLLPFVSFLLGGNAELTLWLRSGASHQEHHHHHHHDHNNNNNSHNNHDNNSGHGSNHSGGGGCCGCGGAGGSEFDTSCASGIAGVKGPGVRRTALGGSTGSSPNFGNSNNSRASVTSLAILMAKAELSSQGNFGAGASNNNSNGITLPHQNSFSNTKTNNNNSNQNNNNNSAHARESIASTLSPSTLTSCRGSEALNVSGVYGGNSPTKQIGTQQNSNGNNNNNGAGVSGSSGAGGIAIHFDAADPLANLTELAQPTTGLNRTSPNTSLAGIPYSEMLSHPPGQQQQPQQQEQEQQQQHASPSFTSSPALSSAAAVNIIGHSGSGVDGIVSNSNNNNNNNGNDNDNSGGGGVLSVIKGFIRLVRDDIIHRKLMFAVWVFFGVLAILFTNLSLFGVCFMNKPQSISTWLTRRGQPALCPANGKPCLVYPMVGDVCSSMVIVAHLVVADDSQIPVQVSARICDAGSDVPNSNSSAARCATVTGTIRNNDDIIEDRRYIGNIYLQGLRCGVKHTAVAFFTTSSGTTLSADQICFHSLPGVSTTATAVTNPSPVELTFIEGGDYVVKASSKSSSSKGRTLLEQAVADTNDASFFAIGGDLAYENNMRRCYHRVDEFLTEVLDALQRPLDSCLVPLLTTVGNHDAGGYLWNGLLSTVLERAAASKFYFQYFPFLSFLGPTSSQPNPPHHQTIQSHHQTRQ